MTFESIECTDDETNKHVKTSISLSQLECRPPKPVPTKSLKQSSEQTESLTLSPDQVEDAAKGISLASASKILDLDKALEPANAKSITRKQSLQSRIFKFFHSIRRRSNSESVKGLSKAGVQIDKDRLLRPPLKHRSLTDPKIDFNPDLLPSFSPSNDNAEFNYIETTTKRSLGSDVNSKECQDNVKKEQIHFPIGTNLDHLDRSGNDSMDSEDSSNYPLKSVIGNESRSDSPLSLNRDSPLSLNHDSSQSHIRERSRSISSPTSHLTKKNSSKQHQTNRYSTISIISVRSDNTAVESGYGSNETSLSTGLDHISQLNLSEGQSSLTPLSENNGIAKGIGNYSMNFESKSSPLADEQNVSRGHSHYTAK